jgi:hypothetical protein
MIGFQQVVISTAWLVTKANDAAKFNVADMQQESVSWKSCLTQQQR